MFVHQVYWRTGYQCIYNQPYLASSFHRTATKAVISSFIAQENFSPVNYPLKHHTHTHTHTHTHIHVYRWGSGKESTCQYSRYKRQEFNTWIRKIPWNRKGQPTPVFLSGKFHGQWSLVGYNLWSSKESDMTEQAHTRECTHTHMHVYIYMYTLICIYKCICICIYKYAKCIFYERKKVKVLLAELYLTLCNSMGCSP